MPRASIRRRAALARPGGSSSRLRPPGFLQQIFLHVDTVLLKRLYVLVFIEHGTRRIHIGGVTAHPTGEWTVQQARNLALTLDERFADIRFLIRDRGSNFTSSFDAVFEAAGTTILPPPSCRARLLDLAWPALQAEIITE
jgi:putative transposase